MHKKQFYEAPDAELLVVRFEESFLGGTYSDPGNAGNPDPYTPDDGTDVD